MLPCGLHQLVCSTVLLFTLFTPTMAQWDSTCGPEPASSIMGEATRQEHLYAQDFDSLKLQTAIKLYSRVVRERPTSAEAHVATERLTALKVSVPAPDTSYSVVEQNRALDTVARQKFIDDVLVGYTRRLVQRGLPLEDVQRSMLATTIEQLSRLRRPDICVMPGCVNIVTGHELCPAHMAEINTYCEHVAKQIRATDLDVEKYVTSIQQVNTLEAYTELAVFLSKTIIDKTDISDAVRSRADKAVIDGKKSLDRAHTAALHLKFVAPTAPVAARLAKKYAAILVEQRANIDGAYSNYYTDGQKYPVDRERLKREYTDAVEALSNDNSGSRFHKCPVPGCETTTGYGRHSARQAALCQVHLDEIDALIDERAAYYKAQAVKTTSSTPTIDVKFRLLYNNGFASSKDLSTGHGSTVQQAIDAALAGVKDIDGADLEPACSITIDFMVSGNNNGVIIKLNGDATNKTLYKSIEEATNKARHPDKSVRSRHNEVALDWLLANWGTVAKNFPEVSPIANDEATKSIPIIQVPDSNAPIMVVAQDIRALSKRIFALYNELCDIKAQNGLKFASRFQEVQEELRTLHGITVTWPATVTKISDESDYEPSVHISARISWANSGGLNVHFVPADQHGEEYLSYSTNISKRYAGSLKVGDIIRIHGTIDKSLLPDPNYGYHRQQAFDYHISLTESYAVEPATITAATVKADREVDKQKAIDDLRAKLQAISLRKPRWPGELLELESNTMIQLNPGGWRSAHIHTIYAWINEFQQAKDRSDQEGQHHWLTFMMADYVVLHYTMHRNDLGTNNDNANLILIKERIQLLGIVYHELNLNKIMAGVQGVTSRWDIEDSDKPHTLDDLRRIISEVCVGSPIVESQPIMTTPGHSISDHEARKTRSAYLIARITSLGNEIDKINANGQNPRNYWRAIIDNQNELLGIYRIELDGNTDPDSVRILRSNITKINRGREFAWNALKQCSAATAVVQPDSVQRPGMD